MARIRLDRDMPDGGGFSQTPMADEQTKAAAMRAQAPAAPAQKFQSPVERALGRDIGSSVNYNAMIDTQVAQAQSVAAKPIMSQAQIDGGGVVKWIGGVSGEYQIVMPIGSPLVGSKAAGWEEGRNRAGVTSGVSPTGIIPGSGATATGGTVSSGSRTGVSASSTGGSSVGGGNSGGGTGGGNTIVGGNNPSPNATLVSTETDDYGNVIGFYSDGTQKTLIASGNKYKSTVDVDAYTLLESTFKDFGLEELVPEIKRFMEEGLGSNQAAIELRKTTAYINRFRGNEIRRQAGLNVVSEAAYLELENDYNETLRAYGLQGYFGVDRKVSQSKMADIIGNDISADEFNNRIETVVTRVNNAEPTIKNTLRAFYNITDTDLVGYFLNPKESLPKLQEKVLSAEIGSEAIRQNLLTDVTGATALAQLGITKEDARRGYQGIAEALPTAQKLGQIYGEEGINYTQATAEQEVFGQLESAKRKRMKLAEKEIGSFSGSSGLARGALGSGNSGAF